MRLCDILKTSVPILTQELDNQNKVNLKTPTRFKWARVGPRSESMSLPAILYKQLHGIYSNKVRLSGVTSALHRDLY